MNYDRNLLGNTEVYQLALQYISSESSLILSSEIVLVASPGLYYAKLHFRPIALGDYHFFPILRAIAILRKYHIFFRFNSTYIRYLLDPQFRRGQELSRTCCP